MLQWNLEKCLKLFKYVYVSSDSDEILAFATSLGAIPIKRSENLCGDVPDITVYRHAVQFMVPHKAIVAVHTNNPSIAQELIFNVKSFMEAGIPEVMTCYPMYRSAIYHLQHNPIYGSIRGISTERLATYGDPYLPDPEVLVVDDSVEIETQEDFELCQSILQSS